MLSNATHWTYREYQQSQTDSTLLLSGVSGTLPMAVTRYCGNCGQECGTAFCGECGYSQVDFIVTFEDLEQAYRHVSGMLIGKEN